MTIEIEKIFQTAAQSTLQFLRTPGQGCYIPAYQRPYSWDNENVDRLLEDAIHGINLLLKRPETISFIGTIITIHDIKHKTVNPIYKPEVAPRVMTIIDGQQRICTFLMLNIVFYELLKKLRKKFTSKTDSVSSWIDEQAELMKSVLYTTFILDMTTGEGLFKFYPRIIRSYDDVWSKKKLQAKYTSPIAHLIWEFIKWANDSTPGDFKFNPTNDSGKPIIEYSVLVNIFRHIKREISRITIYDPHDYDFPELIHITQNNEFIENLWGHEFSDEIKNFIAQESSHKLYNKFCEILRILILSKYINNRMALTVVTVSNEDDAFDMFEALNTTGEPLTAFETFKPKVIEAEGISDYEHSDSYDSISKIDEHLDIYKKAEQKQKATSDILIPFALSDTGEKIQKSLNEQRRYLRNRYEEEDTIEKKRVFTRALSNVTMFIEHSWNKVEQNEFYPLSITDNKTLISFDVLRQIKHNITIAPLSRFYSRAVDIKDSSKKALFTSEFCESIKATCAFSVFWRVAYGGTSNIDNVYREIMKNGVKSERIPPLAKQPKGGPGALSLTNYKKALLYKLESKKIKEKSDWVKAAASNSIYKHSTVIARFVLFCASNDTIPDDKEPGLIKIGRKDVSPIFSLDKWNDSNYFSVEHIAPQNPTNSWDKGIYDDQNIVHRLGNLILLPIEENSILSNRKWEHKRQIYKVLCSKDKEEFEKTKADCTKLGLSIGKGSDTIFSKSCYLGMCQSISKFNASWGLDIINKRSKRIAELTYDYLISWLN